MCDSHFWWTALGKYLVTTWLSFWSAAFRSTRSRLCRVAWSCKATKSCQAISPDCQPSDFADVLKSSRFSTLFPPCEPWFVVQSKASFPSIETHRLHRHHFHRIQNVRQKWNPRMHSKCKLNDKASSLSHSRALGRALVNRMTHRRTVLSSILFLISYTSISSFD